ncbi:helix-turn-helix domain-containing protein [Nitrosomonas sp. Is24]|uniref:helix-turn-helix domain-containing protein n=1 Tax=Nitrosomonas sp. Is24 TaxID=3080533 RepID=UPI00294B9309|nr:helix-turn-helix domain-containing protein [Nitrosomonas sp. Is24]MDV6342945.1 helix-turn-helix domain-containing protein [Nitrosomonas sp. Is24]
MKLKTFIEAAEKKAGKQIELAKMLGISDAYIRMVKAGKRGFPDDICIQLADYIGADRLEVIAASNLVTEKDEKKRKIFESCFTRAAGVTVAALLLGATTIMTSSPANASQASSDSSSICIMLNNKNRRVNSRRKADKILEFFYKLLSGFRLVHF